MKLLVIYNKSKKAIDVTDKSGIEAAVQKTFKNEIGNRPFKIEYYDKDFEEYIDLESADIEDRGKMQLIVHGCLDIEGKSSLGELPTERTKTNEKALSSVIRDMDDDKMPDATCMKTQIHGFAADDLENALLVTTPPELGSGSTIDTYVGKNAVYQKKARNFAQFVGGIPKGAESLVTAWQNRSQQAAPVDLSNENITFCIKLMDLSRIKHYTMVGSTTISELIQTIKHDEGVSVDLRVMEEINSAVIPATVTLTGACIRQDQTIYAYNAGSQQLVYSSSADGPMRSQVR